MLRKKRDSAWESKIPLPNRPLALGDGYLVGIGARACGDGMAPPMRVLALVLLGCASQLGTALAAVLPTSSAGPQIVLFPAGRVPGERNGTFPAERGGSRVSDVTVPTLTPYLVEPWLSALAVPTSS